MSGSSALLDAGIGLQGAGSLLGAFGKLTTGNAAYAAGIGKQQAADYTAAGLQQKGTQAYAAGGSKAQIAYLNGQYVLSAQRADAAGMGGTATAPGVVSTEGQTAARVDYDALTSLYSGQEEMLGYQNQAALEIYQGQEEAAAGASEKTAGIVGAFSSVLGGVGSMAARYGSASGFTGGSPFNSGYE